ncbi:MAG: hypothetical protein ACK5H2_04810 [Beutenbergiaceae bacterium]
MFGPAPGRYQHDDESNLSYSGIYVRTERGPMLAALGELRFTGWVGPQEGQWVLAVTGNPLGKVARNKRRFDDVARDLASTLASAAISIEVARERRLLIAAFDAERELPRYDSDPPEPDDAEITLDDFGNPVMPGGSTDTDCDGVARELLGLLDVDDPEQHLLELLDEDLGESTNESERLLALLRLLKLPTWLVSSDSLPRDVPGGPGRREVIRLGAGKPGVQGRVNDVVWKPVRGKPRP